MWALHFSSSLIWSSAELQQSSPVCSAASPPSGGHTWATEGPLLTLARSCYLTEGCTDQQEWLGFQIRTNKTAKGRKMLHGFIFFHLQSSNTNLKENTYTHRLLLMCSNVTEINAGWIAITFPLVQPSGQHFSLSNSVYVCIWSIHNVQWL